jgi:outer membrane receptor protein involved in Fe transport
MRARLIAGLDYDYSPGERTEDALNFTGCTVPGTATRAQKFNCYRVGPRIYDYEVTYQSASPYLHLEISPLESLRLTAAVRYDTMNYKASNHLAAGDRVITTTGTKHYWQIGSTSQSFAKASPKLGANFALTPAAHIYASYNQGFRAPGEGNLFRAGQDSTLARARTKATDALQLKPIDAEQYELGVRGEAGGLSYDVTAYSLKKDNDILSQRDPTNQTTISTNNGSTKHEGVELGLGMAFGKQWRADVAYSYARHTYETWVTNSFTGANLNGNEIESAPRRLGNARLTWTPTTDTTAQLEWVKMGSYWLDAGNTGKYGGHDLWNLRASHQLSRGLSIAGRIMNLADKRYADSAGGTGAAPTLSPGLPRTVFATIESSW